jgi:hypothetical protein
MMTEEAMIRTTLREETGLTTDEDLETGLSDDAVKIEAEIIIRDETILVNEIDGVEMSLQNQENGSEMTADLGHPVEILVLHLKR